MLLKSGLPIDWMTLYVGWGGVHSDWLLLQLSGEEVTECALEALAVYTGTTDEEAVFHLADADPRNWQEIMRWLSGLAERCGVTQETALRKWQYADAGQTMPGEVDGSEVDRCMDVAEELCDLEARWSPLLSIYPLPRMDFTMQADVVNEEINRLRVWLTEEYTWLAVV